jgi:hypothetical protein
MGFIENFPLFFPYQREKKQKRKKWSFELNQQCTIKKEKEKKDEFFFLLEKGRCIVTKFLAPLHC